MQITMFASFLPAVFYLIGYSMMLSGMFRGNGGRGAGGAMVVGLACMAMYRVLTLLVLSLSRQREYYADRRSAMNVGTGAGSFPRLWPR